MNKLIIGILLVLAMAVSVSAINVNPFTSGWGTCEPNAVAAGGYGNVKTMGDGTCMTAWDGLGDENGRCYESNRNATFTVGAVGMTTTSITISHLDGTTDDTFVVLDESNPNWVCEYTTLTHDGQWHDLTCNLNFVGEKTLTLKPTVEQSWTLCGTYGQVAIHSITYEATSTVPEFGVIAAAIAMVGAVAGIVLFRRH
jgi:hypothetical protein